jgi:preprotein translocase subunit SecA
MDRLKLPEGEAIEHSWVTRAIENAQRKVEGRNFDIRKQLLEFDDVANDQRGVIYEQRNDILDSTDVSHAVSTMREEALSDVISTFVPQGSLEEQWDIAGLEASLKSDYTLELPIESWIESLDEVESEAVVSKVISEAGEFYRSKMSDAPEEAVHQYERSVMLQSIDSHWREHLAALDHLRQGIHLRGYAQKNPKQEYKREAFELFSLLLQTVRNEVTKILMSVRIRSADQVEKVSQQSGAVSNVSYNHSADSATGGQQGPVGSPGTPIMRSQQKVGRNEPCPCGSGKKFKHCHGRLV